MRSLSCTTTALLVNESELEEKTVTSYVGRLLGRRGPADESPLWLVAIAITAVGGAWVLQRVQMPAAWLVGPLVVGVVWSLIRPKMPSVPTPIHRLAMALLGASIAEHVTPQVLSTLKTILGPALLIVALLVVVSVGLGLVFSRLSRLDSISGVLSFLPGAASAIVALSSDMRADPRVVSTLQYLRVTIVVITAPPMAAFMLSSAAISGPEVAGVEPATAAVATTVAAASASHSETDLSAARPTADAPAGAPLAPSAAKPATPLELVSSPVPPDGRTPPIPPSTSSDAHRFPDAPATGILAHVVTWGSVLLGFLLARVLAFNAATLLMPMLLLTFAASTNLPHAPIHPWVIVGAFLVLGMWAGLQFDRRSLQAVGAAALWAIPLIGALILLSGIMGFLLHRFTGISFITAFLATVPGGLETMLATSMSLGANTALVLSIQLLRFILVLVMSPLIAHLVPSRERVSGLP